MAVVPKLHQNEIDEIGDITANLDTLMFESALDQEEYELIYLRKRTHALSVTACAQATFFVGALNESREIKERLHNPLRQMTIKLMKDDEQKDPLVVGIIGCGRLGSHLAHCLLTLAEVRPCFLKISTRRPETLTDLQLKGVTCVNNNVAVASVAHVLFICVLPSQLQHLAAELIGRISPKALVYSFVSSVNLIRMRQLFNHTNMIKPNFQFSIESSSHQWNNTTEIVSSFKNRKMLEKTCPLCPDKENAVVWTEDAFFEQMIYAFVNKCTSLALNKTETVDVLNVVLFDRSASEPLTDVLETWDISSKSGGVTNIFPFFDLTTINNKETPALRKISASPHLRTKFLNKYCSTFIQYLDWKTKALNVAKTQGHVPMV